MSCEDGGNIYAPLLGKGEGNASEPFVEVSNDGLLLFVTHKLGIRDQ
jgi:hypothetical protein